MNYGSASTSNYGANLTHFDFLGRADNVSVNANGMQMSNIAVYKVALNGDQIAECNRGVYPKGSLEIFSPCSDNALWAGNSLLNLGYSDAKLYINTLGLSSVSPINQWTTNTTNSDLYYTTGNVGIGTTSPGYPLHVSGSITGALGSYNFYRQGSSGTTGQTSGNSAISIYASNRIAATEFNAYSDRRIKTNVVDINDASALEILRRIEPKRYHYIDTISRGSAPIWGFIAQQVGEVLDYSTNQITDFVPNVYCQATRSGKTFVTTMSIEWETTNVTGKMKLYDEMNRGRIVTVENFVSPTSFIIQEDLQDTEYFVYGQQVTDFHTLNKDSIYTIATAAIQELDRKLDSTQSTLQSTINALTERITALENR